MSADDTISTATASSPTIINPRLTGSPVVGPSPSIAMIVSTIFRRVCDLIASYRSKRRWLKASASFLTVTDDVLLCLLVVGQIDFNSCS